MTAKLISKNNQQITLEVTIDLKGSMLEMEESILDAHNELGTLATKEALELFDTDGSPIVVGETKLTSRGKTDKTYQTPYGSVSVKRHLYQSSKGGKTYCPLETAARLIRGATPRFAKILSDKYARMAAPEVISDLKGNHGRHVTLRYLQDTSEFVAGIVQTKEESWSYEVPSSVEGIETVVLSMDGAYVLMHEMGYREAMVGSISLYDGEGERQHTIYLGASPEYGKATFKERVEREIKRVKESYPEARYIGIADGAKSNWDFLKRHTSDQLIDFYHASEYLCKAAEASYPGKTEKLKRKSWLKEGCHRLKHDSGAALELLAEMKEFSKKKLTKTVREGLLAAISYFESYEDMMFYAQHVNRQLPIGSGVTEAACKTLVKQRLCQSGMRWKSKGMKVVLSLRQLVRSDTRWDQFWEKINRYGVPAISV